MKAVIKNGRIIKINSGTTEIGRIPKGITLDLVYWTGTKLVNLLTLDKFFVKYINGGFKLHAIQVPHSQLVEMKYSDRKKLWSDNGIYKIKSDVQVTTEKNLELRKGNYPKISDQLDEILRYLETKTDLTDELQGLINDWRGVKTTYPKAEVK